MAAGNKDIIKIMESMGWTDGSFIPIANDENKELMLMMGNLQTDKEKLTVDQQGFGLRNSKLRDNLEHAKNDIAQNLKLLDAHRSQLSDEHHMFKLSEFEDCSLTKNLKDLRNNAKDLEKHDKSTKDELKKSNDTITKLSNKIKWSKDALEEWRLAAARGDQTNKMIANYSKEDAVLAERLETKRRLLQKSLTQQRHVLIEVNEEQRSLETVLDRTSQLYRQAHQERRNLVNTWKEAVVSMRSRDKEIEAKEKELEDGRVAAQKQENELKQQSEFLQRLVDNNREVQEQIEEVNAYTAASRQALNEIIDELALKQNEYVTLKKLCQHVTNLLQQQRHKNRLSAKDVIDKEDAVERNQKLIEALQQKLKLFSDKNFNALERLRSLDELMETEEKNMSKIATENGRLGGLLYRSSKMMIELKAQHKVQEMEIHNLESDIKLIMGNLKKMEQELMRQTQVVYEVDYKTTLYETRLAKMMGKGSQIDKDIFTALHVLELSYEEKKVKRETVRREVLKIEDDMRQLTNTIATTAVELESLQSRLQDKKTEYEGGFKDLASTTLQNQERLVDLSVMKMRVQQMENLLGQQKDKVFNLQRHQANLELAMDERMVEIKLRKELLWQQRKHLDDELTQLRADIGERTLKINAIQARYENAIAILGRNEDGTFVTAMQIKIETAQEKQILLRKGNDLNDRVIKAERDIEAIENTLVLLNYSNNTYRKSLDPVKEDNKELCDLNETTQQYGEFQKQMKKEKANLAEKKIQLNALLSRQSEEENKYEFLAKVRLENNDKLMKLHNEIQEQKSKKERAQRELKIARHTTKSKLDNREFFVGFEKDLKLKELESKNNSALQQVADLVDGSVEMGPVVSKYLFEKGLTIPQPTTCRSSVESSATSVSSGNKWSPRLSQHSFVFENDLSSMSLSLPTVRPTESATVVSLNFMDDQPVKNPSRISLTQSKQADSVTNLSLSFIADQPVKNPSRISLTQSKQAESATNLSLSFMADQSVKNTSRTTLAPSAQVESSTIVSLNFMGDQSSKSTTRTPLASTSRTTLSQSTRSNQSNRTLNRQSK